MSWIQRALAVTFAAAVVATADAQTALRAPTPCSGSFVVRTWQREDGLPSNGITTLFRDHRGFLWIATRDGLVRFDGGAFWPEDAAAGREVFYGIDEDADGTVVLAPRSGDPLRIAAGKWRRQSLPPPYAGEPVNHMLVAPDGAHWFSVRGAVLRESRGRWQTFGTAAGIDARQSAIFATGERNAVWVSSNRLIARYERDQLVPLSIPAGAYDARLVSSRHGGPWVITGSRILKIGADDRAVDIASVPWLEGSHYVNAACEDLEGRLWLGTRSQGLHVLVDGHDISVPTSGDSITALLADAEGTVWAGTRTGGVNAITERRHVLYDTSVGLSVTSVSAVCQDDAGAVWAANGDGGVVRLQNGRVDKWLLMAGERMFAPDP